MPKTASEVLVSHMLIKASPDVVWSWVSDPSKLPTMYPDWVSEVALATANR